MVFEIGKRIFHEVCRFEGPSLIFFQKAVMQKQGEKRHFRHFPNFDHKIERQTRRIDALEMTRFWRVEIHTTPCFNFRHFPAPETHVQNGTPLIDGF